MDRVVVELMVTSWNKSGPIVISIEQDNGV